MADEKKPEPVYTNEPIVSPTVEALKQKIREAGPEGGYVPPHGVKAEMTPETLKALHEGDPGALLEKTHDVPTSHAPETEGEKLAKHQKAAKHAEAVKHESVALPHADAAAHAPTHAAHPAAHAAEPPKKKH